jgi:hypothetical protein
VYPTEPATWAEVETWRREEGLREERFRLGQRDEGRAVFSGHVNDKKNASAALFPRLRTTNGRRRLLGVKATQFMYNPRWALAALEQNPKGVRFVLSLRKPSAWLRSFTLYRMAEVSMDFAQ